ncbi:hypothetical protein PV325_005663 [Microctonus aethiopoides]|uniref:Peroxisomal membrane protein 11C n=1 Tax=Microctonus aethiopoides TaxID=144406 RepID=A0AA39KRP9_9HYME|nr:hypothetical protein PV325_005663 [Microctonus aethiopoides]KAK0171116.1 hypothetical protein PV328_008874 [Microctonus aethiopoides]
MKNLEIISDYLDSYEGRDKFLRTFSYVAKLATILPKSNDTVMKLNRFSSQMSGCRVILRLLDDIPTLHAAINYGWGRQEPDGIMRCLELIELFVDIIYSPIETISWAGGQELISIDVNKWDNVSTYFWIISLSLTLIKSMRKYQQLSIQRKLYLETLSDYNSDVRTVNNLMRNKTLVCIRMMLDLTFAISYLPAGKLWGGKLSSWQIGGIGTISSVIGLYQALSERSANYYKMKKT